MSLVLSLVRLEHQIMSEMEPVSVEEALRQLSAQQQRQQQQMESLMQFLTTQQKLQQAASSSPPPASRSQVAAPRLPSPPAYEGNASALDSWLADLQQQFAWYNITTDEEKLRMGVAFLRGAARDWWIHLPAEERAQQWATFEQALRGRFQPVTAAATAREKLLTLSQGKTSVNDYIAAFRRLLVAASSMSEDDRVFQFLRGLRPAIASQLRMQGVTRLEEAIEKAARIGSAFESFAPAGASSASSAGSASAATAAAPRYAPMELDNIEGLEGETSTEGGGTGSDDTPVTQSQLRELLNAMREERRHTVARPNTGRGGSRSGPSSHRMRGVPVVPHLSPVQVQEYMQAGKCFGCGSTEHQSRGCPKRRMGADGRVSWSN